MTIHPKTHRGHLPVAAIGNMAAILLHERNQARGIEAEATVMDGICRNVTPATGRSRNSLREENSYSTETVRTVVPNAPPQRVCRRHPVRNATVCAPRSDRHVADAAGSQGNAPAAYRARQAATKDVVDSRCRLQGSEDVRLARNKSPPGSVLQARSNRFINLLKDEHL